MNPAIYIDASIGAAPRSAVWDEPVPPAASIEREGEAIAGATVLEPAQPAPQTGRLVRLLLLSRQHQQSARR